MVHKKHSKKKEDTPFRKREKEYSLLEADDKNHSYTCIKTFAESRGIYEKSKYRKKSQEPPDFADIDF